MRARRTSDGRSVQQDLRVAFGALLVALTLVGAGGVAATVLTSTYVDRASSRVVPALESSETMLQTMTEVEAGLRAYELGGSAQMLRLYEQDMRRLAAQRRQLRAALVGDEAMSLLARQSRAIEAWLAGHDVRTDDTASDQSLAVEHAAFDRVRTTSAALRAHLRARLDSLRTRADRARWALVGGVVALTGLGLVVGSVTTRRVSRRVRRPLVHLHDVLTALTRGEHRTRATPSGPRELVSIARSVNALADETDRLRAAEAADRRIQERLLAFGREIRSTLDPDEVVRRGLDELGDALQLSRAYVRLVEDGELRDPSAQYCAPGLGELRDLRTPGSISALQALHKRGVPMASTDVLEDPFFETDRGREWQRRTQARGSMTVPVAVDNVPIGVITCITGRPHEWTETEKNFAMAVAAELGRALEHAQLYTAQVAAVQRLEELDRAKAEFLSSVSHELRTPLTSIHGYVELLEDDDVDPQHRRLLGVVRRNVDRLRVLIEDLLTLSRIESGAFRSTMQAVDLAELVTASVDDVRPQAAHAGVELSVDVPGRRLVVQADSGQLARAVVNVVGNAIKFTPQGGAIDVEVRTDAERRRLDVVVCDTGMGIPEADLERVFTRFFRASNAVTAGVQGTGLGLVIVRTILDNHGGALDLQSKVGEGTTVTLTLPWEPEGGLAGPSA